MNPQCHLLFTVSPVSNVRVIVLVLRFYVFECDTEIEFNFLTILEQFTEIQENVEALPGESVTLITELPEAGLEVTWLKDNSPLSIVDGKYETINKDCYYQLFVPNVTVEDSGEYIVKGNGHESKVKLIINGKFWEICIDIKALCQFLK